MWDLRGDPAAAAAHTREAVLLFGAAWDGHIILRPPHGQRGTSEVNTIHAHAHIRIVYRRELNKSEAILAGLGLDGDGLNGWDMAGLQTVRALAQAVLEKLPHDRLSAWWCEC
jgi:hypothetical protein